jgi:Mg/Co/Ni transporter MgtE
MNNWLKKSLITAVRLVVIGVLLGWLYAWASPKVYPNEGKLGFGYGCVHGALMPMALPSLVMGHDVEIFAANNSGRGYKLGYIVGINVCGLVFFGSAFWTPRRKSEKE